MFSESGVMDEEENTDSQSVDKQHVVLKRLLKHSSRLSWTKSNSSKWRRWWACSSLLTSLHVYKMGSHTWLCPSPQKITEFELKKKIRYREGETFIISVPFVVIVGLDLLFLFRNSACLTGNNDLWKCFCKGSCKEPRCACLQRSQSG